MSNVDNNNIESQTYLLKTWKSSNRFKQIAPQQIIVTQMIRDRIATPTITVTTTSHSKH